MLKSLEDICVKHAYSEVDHVLAGNKKEVEIIAGPDVIVNYLTEKGFEYDLDQNGWQYDFWIKFKNDDKLYYLSGSGFYGLNMTFREDEE